ncbi:MAG: hypothetical protein LKJ83_03510 [Eubacteriaceae bacterium]|jgi:ornithine cyclodeaminase|nr:hypothetical protein [Eubacteriaceae bacterium]
MIIIPEEQAAKAIDIRQTMDAVKGAFRACSAGEMYPGGRIVMPISGEHNNGQWLTAVCRNMPYFGSKFSAVFPGNKECGMPVDQSTISLYSNVNGEQLALIGANYLTALKTGAGAGVATDLLARKDACSLGIIGTGFQAYAQVLAIQEIRELKQLRLFNRHADRLEAFAEKAAKAANRDYEIIKCGSADECAAESDIICTVTPSREPVLADAAVRPGTHINAIGSFTPDSHEIEEKTVARASFITTEHVDAVWQTAGDILIPFNKGMIGKDKVRFSVGDVLSGSVQGRTDDKGITIYESIGSCVLDLAVAIAVYDRWGKTA